MEEIINTFIDVIKKEIKYNKQLLELLIKEQRILTSEDITAVEKNIKEQDYLINTIKKLEEVRIESVKKIAEIYGLPENNLKFKDIVGIVQEKCSEEIFALMEELRSLLENIVKINKNNKYLVESGFNFLEENIKVFYGADRKELFYKKERNENKGKRGVFRIVDKKV